MYLDFRLSNSEYLGVGGG